MYSWSVNVSINGYFYCSIGLGTICSEQVAYRKYEELKQIFPAEYKLCLYRNISYNKLVS